MTPFEVSKPAVEIDDDLDKIVTDLSFDYDAFYDMSRSAGLSRDQITSLLLCYSSKKPRKVVGRYVPRKRRASIYVAKQFEDLEVFRALGSTFLTTMMSRSVNSTTIHETGHHIEYSTGNAKQRQRARDITDFGVTAGHITTLATAITTGHPIAFGALSMSTLLVLGKTYRQSRISPEDKPGEIFAYDFERRNEQEYQVTKLKLASNILG